MSEDAKKNEENPHPFGEEQDEVEIDEVVDGGTVHSMPGNGSETASIREELEKAKNELLYARAEFDNYRKRAMKERSEYLRYAGEQAFVAILDVVDNFERALQTEVTPENLESFKKGVALIADSLKSTLKKFGVQEIESQGAPFDPNMHEAISSEETDALPPGHISQVFRKPYKMHDKVIRPGQVVVAKAKSEKKD
ncbi:MAG TPA: nucleotide exchange factor GrpE [Bdellovibrionales bacterium]|nr:nucleotide exchange factor GrpE [Bdellovibrionales bacterium]